MSYVFSLLSTALFVGVVQNLVFAGGFGSSEAFRMASKPKWLLAFSAFISIFSVLLGTACALLDTLPEINALGQNYHYLIYIGVLTVIYIISCLIALILKAPKGLLGRLGPAALNTLVLSIPMINRLAGFTVYEAAGCGLGAGIAFCIAVLLINAGIKRLRENDEIPPAFKGSPAVFIYAALISLGLFALSGRALMI